MIALLTEARVRLITFAPHTIQTFQVLNVSLFIVLKRRPRYELPFEDESATVTFIHRKTLPRSESSSKSTVSGSERIRL
jgi:hypothetical protein